MSESDLIKLRRYLSDECLLMFSSDSRGLLFNFSKFSYLNLLLFER